MSPMTNKCTGQSTLISGHESWSWWKDESTDTSGRNELPLQSDRTFPYRLRGAQFWGRSSEKSGCSFVLRGAAEVALKQMLPEHLRECNLQSAWLFVKSYRILHSFVCGVLSSCSCFMIVSERCIITKILIRIDYFQSNSIIWLDFCFSAQLVCLYQSHISIIY